MIATARPTRRVTQSYVPSQEEIRQSLLRLHQERGNSFMVEKLSTMPIDEHAQATWERERAEHQERIASMTPSERAAMERAERLEDERLAAEDKLARKRELIRDMASGDPQRRASVNAGSPVNAGKQISHYPAWATKRECKELLASGVSPSEVMKSLGFRQSEKKVAEWLAGLKQQLEQSMLNLAEMAKVTKLNGDKPYRVTNAKGEPLKTKHGKPLDRGGYVRAAAAQEQVDAINASLRERAQKPPTKKQKRAGRSAEIAKSREGRGAAVHAPKVAE